MANFEAANRPCRGGGRQDSIMNPIFIIGMPASGKTTFGRALARRLGREFIDLDFCITQRFRASVAEIFARDGEEAFRRREAAMLREVGEMEDVVVACGGGTPCFSSNMEYMNGRGLTVCLTATPERLRERMLLGGDKRPLVKGKSEAGSMWLPCLPSAGRTIPGRRCLWRVRSLKTAARFRLPSTVSSPTTPDSFNMVSNHGDYVSG